MLTPINDPGPAACAPLPLPIEDTKCPKHPDAKLLWLKQSEALPGGATFTYPKPYCPAEAPHGLSPQWHKQLRAAIGSCGLPRGFEIEVRRKQPLGAASFPGAIDCPSSAPRNLYLPQPTQEALERMRQRIVHGPGAYKRHGLEALTELRLTAIFFGPPGTGKSSAFLTVTQGIVERRLSVSLRALVGSHLGDTEKNLADLSTFIATYANAPGQLAILLDDADDFLSARGNDTSAAGQTLNALKVGMLKLLDLAQAVPVVLTTNRLTALDSAIHRRIVDHIEFPLPDESSRREMIRGFLHAILGPPPFPTAQEEALLAKESEGLSPADISLAITDAMIEVSQRPNARLADIICAGFKWRNGMKAKWSA